MRILLVNPPYVGWLNDIKVEPIGLLYIASYLRAHGHEVALHDTYIGATEDEFERTLIDWRPQIVGCAVYTVSEQFCMNIARLAKRIDGGITMVAGGPHASFVARRMLTRCIEIDIVCHKEAEETMLAIANRLAAGASHTDVPGISYRASSGDVVTNPYLGLQTPLDQLPWPARDLLSERYYETYRATGVITARGCAYKCDFCVSPAFFKGVRKRDEHAVAAEIRQVIRERSIRHVRFYDDVFAYNLARTRKLHEAIGPLGITYDCYIRIDVTTAEMLKLMKASGCIQVRFGVETASEERRRQNKGGRTASLERHREVVAACRELGIESQASYILGFPDETEDDMMETIEFANRLNTDHAGFYKLTPYPGTRYWDMLDEDSVPLDDYTKFDNKVSVNDQVPSARIFDLLTRAYEMFYRDRPFPFGRPDTLRFLTSLPKLRY